MGVINSLRIAYGSWQVNRKTKNTLNKEIKNHSNKEECFLKLSEMKTKFENFHNSYGTIINLSTDVIQHNDLSEKDLSVTLELFKAKSEQIKDTNLPMSEISKVGEKIMDNKAFLCFYFTKIGKIRYEIDMALQKIQSELYKSPANSYAIKLINKFSLSNKTLQVTEKSFSEINQKKAQLSWKQVSLYQTAQSEFLTAKKELEFYFSSPEAACFSLNIRQEIQKLLEIQLPSLSFGNFDTTKFLDKNEKIILEKFAHIQNNFKSDDLDAIEPSKLVYDKLTFLIIKLDDHEREKEIYEKSIEFYVNSQEILLFNFKFSNPDIDIPKQSIIYRLIHSKFEKDEDFFSEVAQKLIELDAETTQFITELEKSEELDSANKTTRIENLINKKIRLKAQLIGLYAYFLQKQQEKNKADFLQEQQEKNSLPPSRVFRPEGATAA